MTTAPSASSTVLLPPYTPSTPAPSYSYTPREDECLVAQSGRHKPHPDTGTYLKRSGRDTIVLTGQDASAAIPTYRRRGLIAGFLDLAARETITDLALKIRGKVSLHIPDMVPTECTFLDESIGLWSMSEECSPPSQLPFAYTLPASFKAGSLDRPLPPSYSSPQSSIAYTLQVTVTRRRTRKFFGSPKNTVCIPFGYRPRTRPGHSTQSFVAGFLQDVKTMPEEWREHAHRVTGKAKADVKPLDLQLYIPSSGVFALDESIPFHVQLTGAVSSLQEVYRADVQKGQRLVEVKIVRQTLVTINGMRTAVLQSVIGRADLVSLPPGAGAEDNEVDGSASLDWSGDLRVNGDVEVASFDAGIVKMQDFIVVELGPSANFERVRHSHSIRLVTDAWDT